jgi:hypothetical protein
LSCRVESGSTDSAVCDFKFGAAATSRATSSRLNTTGKVRGTRTGCILAINSWRSSVRSKKNFSPVSVAFRVMGEIP